MPTPVLSELDHAKIAGMRNQGHPIREISDAMNVSVSTVRRSIKLNAHLIRAEDEELPRLSAGRKSSPLANTVYRQGTKVPLPPANYHARLSQVFDLIEGWNNLSDPSQALMILARHSPEVANAWYTLLLLSAGGWEAKAMQADKRDQPDEEAQVELDSILRRIGNRNGTFHVVIAKMMTNLFFRGAMMTEAVFGKDRETLEDIAVVDPYATRFRPVRDAVLGDGWEIGQYQEGKWVSLEHPTIRYIPFHPLPGEPPYGVPIAQPSVMAAVFLLGIFYDIRRILAKQGFGRMDITINSEMIAERLGINATPQQKRDEVQKVAQDISTLIESLLVDDVLVHSDDASVNRAPGAAGESGVFQGLADLIKLVERQLIKALKSMPLLQGVTDGVSEANSNKQWEIYARGIRYIQQYAENLVGYDLRLALRAKGFDASIKFRLSEVRGVDELRQAETFKKKLEAAIMAEQALYMTPNEASQSVVNHDIPEMYQVQVAGGREPGSLGNINSGSGMNPSAPAENPRNDLVTLTMPKDMAQRAATSFGDRFLRGAVEPEGGEGSLTPIPPGTPDEADLEATQRFWDEHVPIAAGILSGPVVDEEE